YLLACRRAARDQVRLRGASRSGDDPHRWSSFRPGLRARGAARSEPGGERDLHAPTPERPVPRSPPGATISCDRVTLPLAAKISLHLIPPDRSGPDWIDVG